MSSIEIGASRPVGAVQVNATAPASNSPTTSAAASAPAATSAVPDVATSLNTSAGTIPVDQTRVAQIREAVANGNYPLIPTKIGDAMIAAGILLRKTT
jgi:negative regulator of flagellin synthesis FlgM